MSEHYLEVPGARLHYEVSGRGPVLMMVGMPMTGDWLQPLVGQLADDFTSVTFDPRGFGRSTIDDPDQDAVPAESAEDVRAVLSAVTDAPAYVFGTSGGAVTGLALATAHPTLVRTLVAHEPPLLGLLPDAAEQQALARDVHATFLAQGPGPAFAKFMVLVDPDGGAQTTPQDGPPPDEQSQRDGVRMLAHSLLPVTGYVADLDALQAGSTRVLVGGGSASGTGAARRAADVLAVELGGTVVEFPGGHAGFLDPAMGGDPAGFAQVLRTVLL